MSIEKIPAGRLVTFQIKDIDLSIVNSIRRVIISEIPTIAFYFDSSDTNKIDIIINKNTGSLHNEFLAHRISLIPIHFNENEIRTFNNDSYTFKIQKKNKSLSILSVTSADIQVFKDGTLQPPSVRERLFPKNSITGDYVLITKLKPNLYHMEEGEEIDIVCKASKGIGLQHARWSPVSQCSFINLKDDIAGQKAFQEKIQKLEENGKALTDSEKKSLRTQFDTLEAYRYFKKNKFDEPNEFLFSIETECALTPRYLFKEAFGILSQRVQDFAKGIEEDDIKKISYRELPNIPNFFELEIKNETYTLLNLLQSCIYNDNIRDVKGSKVLEFIGYYNPHPLDDKMVLKIKFSSDISKKDNAQFMKKFLIDNCKNISATLNKIGSTL